MSRGEHAGAPHNICSAIKLAAPHALLSCCFAAATLASLAGNGTVATFIMEAPCDSAAKAVLALLEVSK